MFHPTFLAQKVRIQLVRIHIIVCEAKAGTVEVLCKNNTPLVHCCWQCVFEPRNEPHIMFAPADGHFVCACAKRIEEHEFGAICYFERAPRGFFNGRSTL